MEETKQKMPTTVWALGIVSLLMDVSSEIVHSLLPVFLVTALGASFSMVGLIEGAGEAAALILKVFSGPLSDRMGKRKPLVLLGYTLGAISKPLFAIAPTSMMVLGARLFDRTGKGIRGAPRDALVADSVPEKLRGRAFGLRQSLDSVGAFLGPLLAIFLMSLTSENYRLIFWLAVIPGFLSVLVVLKGVKEPEANSSYNNRKPLSWNLIRKFQFSFWAVVIVGGALQLARFSEAFLILRAQNLGLALSYAPIVLVAMNLVYSLSSYPVGWISDRIRREWLLLAGFVLLLISDLVLGFSSTLPQTFVGIVLWGLHMGFTQGILAALVADTCPAEYRGTAYGLFNLVSAGALLLSSLIAGVLWDSHGPQMTFLASAGFALIGGIAFVFLQLRPGKKAGI